MKRRLGLHGTVVARGAPPLDAARWRQFGALRHEHAEDGARGPSRRSRCRAGSTCAAAGRSGLDRVARVGGPLPIGADAGGGPDHPEVPVGDSQRDRVRHDQRARRGPQLPHPGHQAMEDGSREALPPKNSSMASETRRRRYAPHECVRRQTRRSSRQLRLLENSASSLPNSSGSRTASLKSLPFAEAWSA